MPRRNPSRVATVTPFKLLHGSAVGGGDGTALVHVTAYPLRSEELEEGLHAEQARKALLPRGAGGAIVICGVPWGSRDFRAPLLVPCPRTQHL